MTEDSAEGVLKGPGISLSHDSAVLQRTLSFFPRGAKIETGTYQQVLDGCRDAVELPWWRKWHRSGASECRPFMSSIHPHKKHLVFRRRLSLLETENMFWDRKIG